MKTARQVVAEELIQFLERGDIEAQFTEIQNLEDFCQIWEYGKWCCQTGILLGYPRQLKFRHGRPETTAWEGLRTLSDDEAMVIHDATRGLTTQQLEVLVRMYQYWQGWHSAREAMRLGSEQFDALRLSALQHIATGIRMQAKKPVDAVTQ